MEDQKPSHLEWHMMKGRYVAMKGEQIICIIEPVEGMPCEAWGVNPMQGVFSSIDAAKAEAEEGHARFLQRQSEDTKPAYLDALKAVVATLEAKQKA